MPDFSTLMLFSLACLALTATPGPDMLLIATRSISQGRASGFTTLAGIQAGTYVHAAAAALGLSQVMVLLPVAFDIIRWAGAAYLLYLAWTTIRSAGAPPTACCTSSREQMWPIFWQGLLTNILNPKMVLFVLALFPQFVDAKAGSVALQIMVLATVLNFIGLIVNGAAIVLVSRLGRFAVASGRLANLPSYLLATVFAGLAFRLATANRT